MLKPLFFRLFPFMPQGFHDIIRHGINDPHACIVVSIPQADLVNGLRKRFSIFDESCKHSKGVF